MGLLLSWIHSRIHQIRDDFIGCKKSVCDIHIIYKYQEIFKFNILGKAISFVITR
jgi:hypothetical protein